MPVRRVVEDAKDHLAALSVEQLKHHVIESTAKAVLQNSAVASVQQQASLREAIDHVVRVEELDQQGVVDVHLHLGVELGRLEVVVDGRVGQLVVLVFNDLEEQLRVIEEVVDPGVCPDLADADSRLVARLARVEPQEEESLDDSQQLDVRVVLQA